MKRNYLLLLLIIFSIHVMYAQETVVTGNKMALSMDKYITMIDIHESNLFPFDGKVLEIFELNISNKHFIIASIQYKYVIYYTIYTVDRQVLSITESFSFNPVEPEYLDLTRRAIMSHVPGTHLGNMLLSIVDYNGDGLMDIVKVSIHSINGITIGNVFIAIFDTDINDWDIALYEHFYLPEDSKQPPITFTTKDGRLDVDYVQYDGPIADH